MNEMMTMTFMMSLNSLTISVSVRSLCKQCCNYRQKSNLNIFRFFVTKKDFEKTTSDMHYNPEDEIKILDGLNNLTFEQMWQNKNIALGLAEDICKYRGRVGPFSNLVDLKKVKGVGPHSFKVICEKFISDTPSVPKKDLTKPRFEKPLESYFSPELEPEYLKAITSVTSVTVCIDSVYFTTMSKELNVSNWGHIMFNDLNIPKIPPPKILDEALTVVEALPDSNFYLFETRFLKRFAANRIEALLFIAQLQMALTTLLNKDIRQTHVHKVYNVSDTFAQKVFGLNVGGEKISGGHIMKLIEENQYSDTVSITPELWKNFHDLESSLYKERYSSSLLVALAFCTKILSENLPKTDSIIF